MPKRVLSSKRVEFRSIEEEHIEAIRSYVHGENGSEVAGFLDFNPPWAPMSKDQIKAKIDEIRKKDRTLLLGIWSRKGEFLGLGIFGADWDTWSPYIHVLIWPEYRRKGYGTEAGYVLLKASFDHYLAHVTCCSIPDFNREGIAFAESLGFKKQGAQRRVGIADGKYFDCVYLDILKEEYLARRSRGGGK